MRDLDVRDLVSDAGGMLVGVTEFRGGVEDVSMRMREPLTEDDLGESSTFVSRELLRWHCRLEVSLCLVRRYVGSLICSQLSLF